MKKVLLAIVSAGIGFIAGIWTLTWADGNVTHDPERYGKDVLFENDDIKVVPLTNKGDADWDVAGVLYKK